MPTTNPRISVTLSPESAESARKLAEQSGQTVSEWMAALINERLEKENMPLAVLPARGAVTGSEKVPYVTRTKSLATLLADAARANGGDTDVIFRNAADVMCNADRRLFDDEASLAEAVAGSVFTTGNKSERAVKAAQEFGRYFASAFGGAPEYFAPGSRQLQLLKSAYDSAIQAGE